MPYLPAPRVLPDSHSTFTEPKRALLKERVKTITDVFPNQDRPLPKLDILAVLCAYAGQPVSILGDLDIRLVLTEIITGWRHPITTY